MSKIDKSLRFDLACFTLMVLGTFLFVGSLANAESGGSASINQAVAEMYRQDKQEAVLREDIADVDTAATALTDENLAILEAADQHVDLGTAGKTGASRINIPVSARFSATGQTCKVRWVVCNRLTSTTYYVKDISDEITLTGADFGGSYFAPTYVFDSFGGEVGFVILTDDPASGTVSFGVGSY